jgi:glycosyltransferase involved in cell wall biosynthesis
MKNSIFYIGSFPPPFGGATIKNKNLSEDLERFYIVKYFNTSQLKTVFQYAKLLLFLIINNNKKGVICIFDHSLFKLSKAIYFINRKMLQHITVFITGGQFHNRIVERNENLDIYKQYNKIIVECYGMEKKLIELGFKNVITIPNLRKVNVTRKFIYNNQKNDTFKCIFLSQVTKEKGIFSILKANKLLSNEINNYQIDIFGPISETIKDEFYNELESQKNINYRGLFISSKENSIYDFLKEYDVLIFPTQYEGEGFPGILAEAKIAGIPVIATDFMYNSEIINNNIDGMLINTDGVIHELSSSIKILYNDRGLTLKLRSNSFKSGENYIQENYIQKIKNIISGNG